MSNHSCACSCSTHGANGRKLSRNLILRFMVACIFGERGSPRMLRAPRARGPNSIRPWNQPTTFSSASSPATCSQQLRFVRRSAGRRASTSFRNCSICVATKATGPGSCLCWASPPMAMARLVQQLVPDEQGRAQRAAGVARRRLNPEVLERPLAQQPAVGDAVERHAAGQDQVLQAGLAVQVHGPSAAGSPRSPPGCWRPGPCAAARAAIPAGAAGRRRGR